MNQPGRVIRFLKTTGIGGIVFLLPLVVIGALLGQAAQIVWMIAGVIGDYVPVKTPSGIALLLLAAIAVLLLLCFAAGLLAQRSLGRAIHGQFEKYLLLLFPRYSIFKDQLSGALGGAGAQAHMPAVLIQMHDSRRVGFLMDRTDDQLAVVYLPGAPDPWSGQVICVQDDQLQEMHTDFGETVATFERLGRGQGDLLAASSASLSSPSSGD